MQMRPPSLLRSTWNELRRRKVTRVGALYAVVAWLVLQIAEITFDPLGLPPWALTWTVLGAVLGLPVALVLAWFFEVSPSGLVRDRSVGRAAGRLFAVLVVLLTVSGLGWWLATVYHPGAVPAADSAETATPARAELPANAIAVLPFDDMSPERDHRHLADGIAEELLDRLAQLQGLRVAARTSSFALREFAGTVQDMGQLLGVRWVLEGSVRRSSGRVRITAQLIDADSGYHAWSETYERPAEDLFALQDEVTGAIASELERRITGVGGSTSVDSGTRDAQALELYLRGRQTWRLRSPASLAEAEALFAQAVERDPDYAQAWCGLADAYLLQGDYGLRPVHEAITLAEPAAVRAITLDPALGEAWASVGLLRSMAGQLGPARRSLEEAIRLDPRYEMARMWLAGVLGDQGRISEQRSVLEQARELNPLEPVINVNLSALMVAQGEADAARALLERVLAVTPSDPLLLRSLANIETQTGRLDRALEFARRAHRSDPSAPSTVLTLAHALFALQAWDEAAALIEAMPEDSPYRWSLAQTQILQRGGDTLLPRVRERVHALLDSGGALSAQDRDLLVLAATVRTQADPTEAIAYLRRVVPEPSAMEQGVSLLDAGSLLVTALQMQGQAREAEAYRQSLSDAARGFLDRPVETGQLAFSRALMAEFVGERQQALTAIDRAIDLGFRQAWLLRYDPRLAELRSDPGFALLVQRIDAEIQKARQGVGMTLQSGSD
jgi:TolB-like protein/Tfp pilus assembly protein PilF